MYSQIHTHLRIRHKVQTSIKYIQDGECTGAGLLFSLKTLLSPFNFLKKSLGILLLYELFISISTLGPNYQLTPVNLIFSIF